MRFRDSKILAITTGSVAFLTVDISHESWKSNLSNHERSSGVGGVLADHGSRHQCDVGCDAIMEPIDWDFSHLTREQRIHFYYFAMADTHPGPDLSMVATMIACRVVNIEDRDESS